jgi:hypothetical protein
MDKDKPNDQDFLDKIMSQAISQMKGDDISQRKGDDFDTELDDLVNEIEDMDFDSISEPSIEEDKMQQVQIQTQSKKDDDRRSVMSELVLPSPIRKDIKTSFSHSNIAIIVSGVNKGKDVEVKYYTPGKLEIEFGMNQEIISNTQLRNGDIINNCVVLAQLSPTKYLGHCTNVTFISPDDVERYGKDGINRAEILYGSLTGVHGLIRNEYKPKVGVVLDNTPMTINVEDIFYKDLLLKNDKYFQVSNVIMVDYDQYTLTGREMGSQQDKDITMDDVKQIMRGFKIGGKIEESYDDDVVSYRHSVASERSSEPSDKSETSELLFDDTLDTFDFGGEEDRQTSTFKDVERTQVVFQGWSMKQKSYIDLVKRILSKNDLPDDTLDMYKTLDSIETILSYFDKEVSNSGENFDIYSSNIDVKMIIACIVAYSLVGVEGGFIGFSKYVEKLFNSGYFSGDLAGSVLVELRDVFECTELKRTRVQFERVTMLMTCFNRLIQAKLGTNISLESTQGIRRTDTTVEPVVRKVNQYDRKGFTLPEQLFSDEPLDVDTKILWGPNYSERISKWRTLINGKLRGSSGTTHKVYSFIEKNIEMSPMVLYKLRDSIVDILKNNNVNITDLMSSCNKVRTCEDEVIRSQLKILVDDILVRKIKRITTDEYEKINIYLRLGDFVREFLSDMKKLYEYNKTKRQRRFEELASERESSLQRRSEAISRVQTQSEPSVRIQSVDDQIRMLLKRTLKYKFDENCKDEQCKVKELVTTVKRVLNTQEQMLLTPDEVKLLREYYNKYSDLVVQEPKQLPKIILKLRRPQTMSEQ